MAKKVLHTLLIGLAGSVAGIAWLFIVMAGTGESHAADVVALYLCGVFPAAVVGAAVGLALRGRLSTAPIVIGWLISLWLTPPGFTLMNSANTRVSIGEMALMTMFVVPYYLAGTLCTGACSRTSIGRSARPEIP